MSKLTKEQVQEIIRTPRTRGTMKALAEQYGVSQGRISQIFKSHGGGTSNVAPEQPLSGSMMLRREDIEDKSEVVYELKY